MLLLLFLFLPKRGYVFVGVCVYLFYFHWRYTDCIQISQIAYKVSPAFIYVGVEVFFDFMNFSRDRHFLNALIIIVYLYVIFSFNVRAPFCGSWFSSIVCSIAPYDPSAMVNLAMKISVGLPYLDALSTCLFYLMVNPPLSYGIVGWYV